MSDIIHVSKEHDMEEGKSYLRLFRLFLETEVTEVVKAFGQNCRLQLCVCRQIVLHMDCSTLSPGYIDAQTFVPTKECAWRGDLFNKQSLLCSVKLIALEDCFKLPSALSECSVLNISQKISLETFRSVHPEIETLCTKDSPSSHTERESVFCIDDKDSKGRTVRKLAKHLLKHFVVGLGHLDSCEQCYFFPVQNEDSKVVLYVFIQQFCTRDSWKYHMFGGLLDLDDTLEVVCPGSHFKSHSHDSSSNLCSYLDFSDDRDLFTSVEEREKLPVCEKLGYPVSGSVGGGGRNRYMRKPVKHRRRKHHLTSLSCRKTMNRTKSLLVQVKRSTLRERSFKKYSVERGDPFPVPVKDIFKDLSSDESYLTDIVKCESYVPLQPSHKSSCQNSPKPSEETKPDDKDGEGQTSSANLLVSLPKQGLSFKLDQPQENIHHPPSCSQSTSCDDSVEDKYTDSTMFPPFPSNSDLTGEMSISDTFKEEDCHNPCCYDNLLQFDMSGSSVVDVIVRDEDVVKSEHVFYQCPSTLRGVSECYHDQDLGVSGEVVTFAESSSTVLPSTHPKHVSFDSVLPENDKLKNGTNGLATKEILAAVVGGVLRSLERQVVRPALSSCSPHQQVADSVTSSVAEQVELSLTGVENGLHTGSKEAIKTSRKIDLSEYKKRRTSRGPSVTATDEQVQQEKTPTTGSNQPELTCSHHSTDILSALQEDLNNGMDVCTSVSVDNSEGSHSQLLSVRDPSKGTGPCTPNNNNANLSLPCLSPDNTCTQSLKNTVSVPRPPSPDCCSHVKPNALAKPTSFGDNVSQVSSQMPLGSKLSKPQSSLPPKSFLKLPSVSKSVIPSETLSLSQDPPACPVSSHLVNPPLPREPPPPPPPSCPPASPPLPVGPPPNDDPYSMGNPPLPPPPLGNPPPPQGNPLPPPSVVSQPIVPPLPKEPPPNEPLYVDPPLPPLPKDFPPAPPPPEDPPPVPPPPRDPPVAPPPPPSDPPAIPPPPSDPPLLSHEQSMSGQMQRVASKHSPHSTFPSTSRHKDVYVSMEFDGKSGVVASVQVPTHPQSTREASLQISSRSSCPVDRSKIALKDLSSSIDLPKVNLSERDSTSHRNDLKTSEKETSHPKDPRRASVCSEVQREGRQSNDVGSSLQPDRPLSITSSKEQVSQQPLMKEQISLKSGTVGASLEPTVVGEKPPVGPYLPSPPITPSLPLATQGAATQGVTHVYANQYPLVHYPQSWVGQHMHMQTPYSGLYPQQVHTNTNSTPFLTPPVFPDQDPGLFANGYFNVHSHVATQEHASVWQGPTVQNMNGPSLCPSSVTSVMPARKWSSSEDGEWSPGEEPKEVDLCNGLGDSPEDETVESSRWKPVDVNRDDIMSPTSEGTIKFKPHSPSSLEDNDVDDSVIDSLSQSNLDAAGRQNAINFKLRGSSSTCGQLTQSKGVQVNMAYREMLLQKKYRGEDIGVQCDLNPPKQISETQLSFGDLGLEEGEVSILHQLAFNQIVNVLLLRLLNCKSLSGVERERYRSAVDEFGAKLHSDIDSLLSFVPASMLEPSNLELGLGTSHSWCNGIPEPVKSNKRGLMHLNLGLVGAHDGADLLLDDDIPSEEPELVFSPLMEDQQNRASTPLMDEYLPVPDLSMDPPLQDSAPVLCEVEADYREDGETSKDTSQVLCVSPISENEWDFDDELAQVHRGKSITKRESTKGGPCKGGVSKKELDNRECTAMETSRKELSKKEQDKSERSTREVSKKELDNREHTTRETSRKELSKKEQDKSERTTREVSKKELDNREHTTRETSRKEPSKKEQDKSERTTREVSKKELDNREHTTRETSRKELRKKEQDKSEHTKRESSRRSRYERELSKKELDKSERTTKELKMKEPNEKEVSKREPVTSKPDKKEKGTGVPITSDSIGNTSVVPLQRENSEGKQDTKQQLTVTSILSPVRIAELVQSNGTITETMLEQRIREIRNEVKLSSSAPQPSGSESEDVKSTISATSSVKPPVAVVEDSSVGLVKRKRYVHGGSVRDNTKPEEDVKKTRILSISNLGLPSCIFEPEPEKCKFKEEVISPSVSKKKNKKKKKSSVPPVPTLLDLAGLSSVSTNPLVATHPPSDAGCTQTAPSQPPPPPPPPDTAVVKTEPQSSASCDRSSKDVKPVTPRLTWKFGGTLSSDIGGKFKIEPSKTPNPRKRQIVQQSRSSSVGKSPQASTSLSTRSIRSTRVTRNKSSTSASIKKSETRGLSSNQGRNSKLPLRSLRNRSHSPAMQRNTRTRTPLSSPSSSSAQRHSKDRQGLLSTSPVRRQSSDRASSYHSEDDEPKPRQNKREGSLSLFRRGSRQRQVSNSPTRGRSSDRALSYFSEEDTHKLPKRHRGELSSRTGLFSSKEADNSAVWKSADLSSEDTEQMSDFGEKSKCFYNRIIREWREVMGGRNLKPSTSCLFANESHY